MAMILMTFALAMVLAGERTCRSCRRRLSLCERAAEMLSAPKGRALIAGMNHEKEPGLGRSQAGFVVSQSSPISRSEQ